MISAPVAFLIHYIFYASVVPDIIKITLVKPEFKKRAK